MLGVVDAGHDVRRVVARVRNAVAKRYSLPAFAEAIQNDRFEVVVLTPTEGKKIALEKAFALRDSGRTPVRVEVVPELEPLVLRKLDRRAR